MWRRDERGLERPRPLRFRDSLRSPHSLRSFGLRSLRRPGGGERAAPFRVHPDGVAHRPSVAVGPTADASPRVPTATRGPGPTSVGQPAVARVRLDCPPRADPRSRTANDSADSVPPTTAVSPTATTDRSDRGVGLRQGPRAARTRTTQGPQPERAKRVRARTAASPGIAARGGVRGPAVRSSSRHGQGGFRGPAVRSSSRHGQGGRPGPAMRASHRSTHLVSRMGRERGSVRGPAV